MAEITNPKQAGERLLAFAREGRLVQNTWHGEEDGREVACLLGAAAGIDEATQCPASLMPSWAAWALPLLFDGQTEAHAIAFAIRWGEAMIRDEWVRIDWDSVRAEWLAFVVKQAKDAAATARAAHVAAHAAAAVIAASYAVSDVSDASHAADAAYAADAATRAAYTDAEYAYAARDAQADALMNAIERAMEVARG